MAMDLQRIEVRNITGIQTDPNPSDLPPNKWSFGSNVKFRNGKAEMVDGYSEVFPPAPETLLHIMPYLFQNTPYWFGASATKIRRTIGTGTWLDMSRLVGGAYTASRTNNWNGGFLSGVAILNNGSDVPQSLLPTANNFTDLPNWPSLYRCKIMRPFKNYLIALNITNNSVVENTTVKWSAPADPGQVPSTWDITDPTNDAGEYPLADTPGAIVDGKKLRDAFLIYKEDSVYSMRYIGGTFVFQFQQLFDDVGMLSPNCVAEFDGKHFVVGRGDVYVHNGVQKQSVIDGHVKDFLFNAVSDNNVASTFVIPDYNNTEMIVCFSQSTGAVASGYCDKAVVWNWTDNEWSIRDIPNILYAIQGIVDPQDPNDWDSDPLEWDTDTSSWGSQTYNPAKNKIVMLGGDPSKCYVLGGTTRFDGSVFTTTLERSDMYFEDDLKVKSFTSLTPHIYGQGIAKFWIGSSMVKDSPVEWNGPYLFNIGVDHHLTFRHFGRFVGVKFEMTSDKYWNLNGFTMEFTPLAGKR